MYKYYLSSEKVNILQKAVKAEGKKTPKSAPPAHIKRKKLEEEINEKLSDDEFEVRLDRDNYVNRNCTHSIFLNM